MEFALVMGGRWYLEWYIKKGVTRIRKKVYGGINRGKTSTDRIAIAEELAAKISLGLDLKPQKQNELESLLETFKPTLRKKTYSTIKSRLKVYTEFLERNNIHPLKVRTEDLNQFILEQMNTGKNHITIKSYINSLKGLYNRIDLQPFERVIKIKAQSQSLMYYDAAQKRAIMEWATKHNFRLKIAIQLIYSCFIRPGEIRMLKREDFNFDGGFIQIRPEVSKNGKSQKVAIPYGLMGELQYIQHLPFGAFILSKSPKKTIGMNYLNLQNKKALNALKIQGNYAFYSWKHTGVVDAVRAGINVKDIQLQLRHHSLDMVNEYLKNLGIMDSTDFRNKMPVIN